MYHRLMAVIIVSHKILLKLCQAFVSFQHVERIVEDDALNISIEIFMSYGSNTLRREPLSLISNMTVKYCDCNLEECFKLIIIIIIIAFIYWKITELNSRIGYGLSDPNIGYLDMYIHDLESI